MRVSKHAEFGIGLVPAILHDEGEDLLRGIRTRQGPLDCGRPLHLTILRATSWSGEPLARRAKHEKQRRAQTPKGNSTARAPHRFVPQTYVKTFAY